MTTGNFMAHLSDHATSDARRGDRRLEAPPPFRHAAGYTLEEAEIRLVLGACYPAEPAMDQVPAYSFHICVRCDGQRAGNITLRVGHNDYVDRYIGNIGYHVDFPYRGRKFAARACRLVRALALEHGMTMLWITCNPENIPSRRTCEIVGARYVETIAVPRDSDLYYRGDRLKRRYRWDLTDVPA